MKRIATLLACLMLVICSFTSSLATKPLDLVPSGHWIYEELSKLSQAGLIDLQVTSGTQLTRASVASLVKQAQINAEKETLKKEIESSLEKLSLELRAELATDEKATSLASSVQEKGKDGLAKNIAELEKIKEGSSQLNKGIGFGAEFQLNAETQVRFYPQTGVREVDTYNYNQLWTGLFLKGSAISSVSELNFYNNVGSTNTIYIGEGSFARVGLDQGNLSYKLQFGWHSPSNNPFIISEPSEELEDKYSKSYYLSGSSLSIDSSDSKYSFSTFSGKDYSLWTDGKWYWLNRAMFKAPNSEQFGITNLVLRQQNSIYNRLLGLEWDNGSTLKNLQFHVTSSQTIFYKKDGEKNLDDLALELKFDNENKYFNAKGGLRYIGPRYFGYKSIVVNRTLSMMYDWLTVGYKEDEKPYSEGYFPEYGEMTNNQYGGWLELKLPFRQLPGLNKFSYASLYLGGEYYQAQYAPMMGFPGQMNKNIKAVLSLDIKDLFKINRKSPYLEEITLDISGITQDENNDFHGLQPADFSIDEEYRYRRKGEIRLTFAEKRAWTNLALYANRTINPSDQEYVYRTSTFSSYRPGALNTFGIKLYKRIYWDHKLEVEFEHQDFKSAIKPALDYKDNYFWIRLKANSWF